jgi:hypothetical protein
MDRKAAIPSPVRTQGADANGHAGSSPGKRAELAHPPHELPGRCGEHPTQAGATKAGEIRSHGLAAELRPRWWDAAFLDQARPSLCPSYTADKRSVKGIPANQLVTCRVA